MIPTAPLDRAVGLLLCGWPQDATDDDVPDAILADALADRFEGGDALLFRRHLALCRARRLLVLLAAHDEYERCGRCGHALISYRVEWGTGWCHRCRDHRRPGPTPEALAALLAGALEEASDPRAAWWRRRFPISLTAGATAWVCGECRAVLHADLRPDVCPACGPVDALLPPLLTREALGAAVAALKERRR